MQDVSVNQLSTDENIYIKFYPKVRMLIAKKLNCKLQSKVKLMDGLILLKKLNLPINSSISWIGGKTQKNGIRKPRLPFCFNNESGGMLIASVLGDGMMDKKHIVSYINWSPKLRKQVIYSAKNVFGDVDISTVKDNNRIVFPVVIGKILNVVGINPGRKTITNPNVPECVKRGNRKCKIGFLKQMSDDEGSPMIRPRRSYSIRYEFAVRLPKNKFEERKNYIPNLLIDTKELFEKLGFRTTRIYGGRIYRGRRHETYAVSWAFDILGRDSIEKFAKEIGFRLEKRQKKLMLGLRSIQKRILPKSDSYHTVLSAFKQIIDSKSFATKHSFRPAKGYSLRSAESWLNKLNRKGFIKIISGGEHIGGGWKALSGRAPYRFVITEKGKFFLRNFRKIQTPSIAPSFAEKVSDPWWRER